MPKGGGHRPSPTIHQAEDPWSDHDKGAINDYCVSRAVLATQ
jgi:hypothetical protein